jgi:hypothetical protein
MSVCEEKCISVCGHGNGNECGGVSKIMNSNVICNNVYSKTRTDDGESRSTSKYGADTGLLGSVSSDDKEVAPVLSVSSVSVPMSVCAATSGPLGAQMNAPPAINAAGSAASASAATGPTSTGHSSSERHGGVGHHASHGSGADPSASMRRDKAGSSPSRHAAVELLISMRRGLSDTRTPMAGDSRRRPIPPETKALAAPMGCAMRGHAKLKADRAETKQHLQG